MTVPVTLLLDRRHRITYIGRVVSVGAYLWMIDCSAAKLVQRNPKTEPTTV